MHSNKWFNVDFDHRAWIVDFECLQNGRMQHTNFADGNALVEHIGASAGEEGRIFDGLQIVAVFAWPRHLEQLHDTIQ